MAVRLAVVAYSWGRLPSVTFTLTGQAAIAARPFAWPSVPMMRCPSLTKGTDGHLMIAFASRMPQLPLQSEER